MRMYDFAVEFVFDYMVILTDVDVIFHKDINAEFIENKAKDNLKTEYGIDIDSLNGLQDVIIHDKDYGYTPPSERLEWTVQ